MERDRRNPPPRQPERRELSTRQAESAVFEHLGAAVHGMGYPSPRVEGSLLDGYPAPLPNLFNIGLLHTAVDGRPGHARYAPCSVAELVNKGYEYWALGHVHHREVLHRDPWLVFPGNLQGRHMRETGPKGATLVHTEGQRVVLAPLGPLELQALETVWRIVSDTPATDRKSSAQALLTARCGIPMLRVIFGMGRAKVKG